MQVSAEATSRLNVRQLVLLVIAMFVAMMVLTLPVAQLDKFVSRLLPDGGADLALENTAKGFFQTAHFLAYIPFAFIWGALSDRSGKRKPILLIGMSGQAVMYFLIPLHRQHLAPLRRPLHRRDLRYRRRLHAHDDGARHRSPGQARHDPRHLHPRYAPRQRCRHSPRRQHLQARPRLPILAGRDSSRHHLRRNLLPRQRAGAQTRAYSFRRALAAFHEQPRLIIPYAFSFLDRLTVGFFISTFILLVRDVYKFDAGQAGAYLGIFLGCFALFSPLGGILSDRLGRAKPMILGTAIYGITLLLIGRVAPEMLYAVMAIGGLSGAILYPPSIALVGDYASPGQRGVAMGGFNLAGSTGFALGPILFGLIADAYGLLATPLVAGALCLLAAAVAAPILLRKEGRDTVSPELQT